MLFTISNAFDQWQHSRLSPHPNAISGGISLCCTTWFHSMKIQLKECSIPRSGVESEPILVPILNHLRSTADRLGACLFWRWHVTIYAGGCSTSWIWSVPRCASASATAVSHTTAGLNCQLITATCCRKHSTFHCHSSLLDQVLSDSASPGDKITLSSSLDFVNRARQ